MGNTAPTVYADALTDPPIVTTYMQATHPRQTAIPRTTYVRTRYNFEQAEVKEGAGCPETDAGRGNAALRGNISPVINDRSRDVAARASALPRLLLHIFLHCACP